MDYTICMLMWIKKIFRSLMIKIQFTTDSNVNWYIVDSVNVEAIMNDKNKHSMKDVTSHDLYPPSPCHKLSHRAWHTLYNRLAPLPPIFKILIQLNCSFYLFKTFIESMNSDKAYKPRWFQLAIRLIELNINISLHRISRSWISYKTFLPSSWYPKGSHSRKP